MMKPQSHLRLTDRATVTFDRHANQLRDANAVRRCLVAVSGYESRSRHWVCSALQQRVAIQDAFEVRHVFGMTEHRDVLSRPENDKFYSEQGLVPHLIDSDESAAFLSILADIVSSCVDSCETPCEIHVDYSSMPRSWYCSIPLLLDSKLRPGDSGFLWYSPGEYPDSEYPTVGVNDFRVMSGRASLNPHFRTHLMGLGFDRIRSQAIWGVIDPENLITFYADPASRPDYVQTVRERNEDVLRAASHELPLPLFDISKSLETLISTVREFRSLGDVIIVPDGPKPFILASSMLPDLVGCEGVVCFHVARRKTRAIEPVDVVPHGDPFALRLSSPSDVADATCGLALPGSDGDS